MKNIFTFLSSLFFLHAGAQISGMNNWKTQIDLKFFSTVQYPPDWKTGDVNADGYIIRSPLESDTDKFRENVSFFAMEVPDSIMKADIKAIAESNFIETKKMIKDTRVMANRYITINGIPMYLVVYNGIFSGQYLYWKQLFCVHKNVFYILTYSGEAGKKDKYAITGGDILFSFRPNNVIDG